MANEVLVAVIAFLGTLTGTFGGIMATNKLVNHRLMELEKKVDKHNRVVERTYILEEKMKAAARRLDVLEGKTK